MSYAEIVSSANQLSLTAASAVTAAACTGNSATATVSTNCQVLQQGTITITAAGGVRTVACATILATDRVIVSLVTKTSAAATQQDYVLAINAGVNFTLTPNDNAFAGVFNYLVVRSNATAVNAP